MVSIASHGSIAISNTSSIASNFSGGLSKNVLEFNCVVSSAGLVFLEVELHLGIELLSGEDVSLLLLFSLKKFLSRVGEVSDKGLCNLFGLVELSFLLLESEFFKLEFHVELGVFLLLSEVTLEEYELLIIRSLKSSKLSSLFSGISSCVSSECSCVGSVLSQESLFAELLNLSHSFLTSVVFTLGVFLFKLVFINLVKLS